MKPVVAAAPAVSSVAGLLSPAGAEVWAAYAPFIRESFVSLVGSGVQVLVDVVLSQGLVLTVLPIPAHNVCLSCELVQGEVDLGVQLALPLESVHVILGNGLAGSRLWASVLPSPVASLSSTKEVANEDHRVLPHVPSACVVTRSMCKAELVSEENDGNVILDVPTLIFH